MNTAIVWFKRDLRTHDHAALTQAADYGRVIPLYILEPELWVQPDMSYRHYQFLLESLRECYASLSALGQPLIIRVGDAVEVLDNIAKEHQASALFSHQETWNSWTYQRNLRVKS